MVISHLTLLLLMGLAVVAALGEALRSICGRMTSLFAAGSWYLLCFVPLVLLGEGEGGEPTGLSPVDFAGAVPLHLSVAVFLWAMARLRRQGQVENKPMAGLRPQRAIALVLTLSAAWVAWLVALEGELTGFTGALVLNSVAAGASGASTAAVLSLRDRAMRSQRMLWGALAGLAASSATAASVSLLSAVVIGVIAGSIAGIAGLRAAHAFGPWGTGLGAAGIGAAVGLLALGLVDDRSGFFFTGQPTLLLAQLAAVLLAVMLSTIVGVVIRALVSLKAGTAHTPRRDDV